MTRKQVGDEKLAKLVRSRWQTAGEVHEPPVEKLMSRPNGWGRKFDRHRPRAKLRSRSLPYLKHEQDSLGEVIGISGAAMLLKCVARPPFYSSSRCLASGSGASVATKSSGAFVALGCIIAIPSAVMVAPGTTALT
jgi:hypothetical protein